ncbi:MAG: tetratricopeptide repeat protein [Coleofasciculaceae cyanobacterium]
MTVKDTALQPEVSSWNRQTYQRLKLALSLGLRRQIFVAVCDDLALRNRLASKLQSELGQTLNDQRSSPQLVSLNLNLNDPNPLAQIAQWLAQNQLPSHYHLNPGFQILGVERLTRQPPGLQRLFLRHLQAIERNLPRWESTMLLWLPRPWFHTVVQSAPEFWQWHTGLFEFEGEPTPLPPVGNAQPETSSTPESTERDERETASFHEDLQTLLADHEDVDTGKLPPVPTTSQEDLDFSPAQEYLLAETETADDSSTNGFRSETNQETVSSYDNSGFSATAPFELNLQIDPIEEVASPADAININLHEEEHPEQEEQSDLAKPIQAYLELGNHYRKLIEQGEASEENLTIAIQAYEQALHWLEDNSPQAPDVLNDLGNLYWMLSRCPANPGQRLSYLEQAIVAYQLALTKLTAKQDQQTYGMIQNNLGAAYGDLAQYKDSVENLQLSIRAYEEALNYRRAESEPLKYASTQNNLGTAYWNLAQQVSSPENLRASISAYSEALSYYDPHSAPLNWAMIQNNLGTAYWNLAQYERPEAWLKLAIFAYQDALKYRTLEAAPAAYAASQNNLGTAYWHLADRCQHQARAREEYLQKCLAAYKSAISTAEQLNQQEPPLAVNFDLFATRNNLGLAYYQLATGTQFSLSQESQSAHLHLALEQHIQVCQGSGQSDSYQTALSYVIKIIRSLYQESGISGQNLALSKVPGQLLPEILPRL